MATLEAELAALISAIGADIKGLKASAPVKILGPTDPLPSVTQPTVIVRTTT